MNEIVITVLNEEIAELVAIDIEKKTNNHCEIREVKMKDWNTKIQSFIESFEIEFPDGCNDINCSECNLHADLEHENLCNFIRNRGK